MARPLVLAHRAGPAGRHPENSLAALRATLRGRADGVEIDVQRDGDGRYVVHHDATLRDGTPIAGCTAKRLSRVRLANGEPLPLLEPFLAEARRGLVFLDLKVTCDPVEVARRASAVLPADRLFFSSFWHPGIRALGRRFPALRRGVTLEARLVDPASVMRAAGASVLVLPADCVDRETARAADVWVWGVADRDGARTLTRWGVKALIVDDPAVAVQV